MKDYLKPEVEIVDFAVEEIATTPDGETGTGSANVDSPFGQ